MSELIITTVVENTVRQKDLLAEHGLSFYIKKDNVEIIFDTGQGHCLKPNADILKIDFQRTSHAILSHGHYDHTGGLKSLLDENNKIKIHGHPDAFSTKYKKDNNKYIEIGLPPESKNSMGKAEIIYNRGAVEIEKNIFLTGEIPPYSGFEKDNTEFYIYDKYNKRYKNDTFRDEQALWIKTSKGLVVISGCAHCGIINTLEYISKLVNERIFAVIGGTHLLNADEERMFKTAEKIKEMEIKFFETCHCTGLDSYVYLKKELGGRISYLFTGSMLVL